MNIHELYQLGLSASSPLKHGTNKRKLFITAGRRGNIDMQELMSQLCSIGISPTLNNRYYLHLGLFIAKEVAMEELRNGGMQVS